MTARRRGIAGCAVLLALAMAAAPAAAQWRSVEADGKLQRAVVRNDDGATVRISMDADKQVYVTFQLPSGLATLDPQGCPTFQIDDYRPEDFANDAHECQVSVNTSRVLLARIADGRLQSPTLQHLMDGRELTVRYRMEHAGYGASRFTLRRSKQALIDVIGEATEVITEF